MQNLFSPNLIAGLLLITVFRMAELYHSLLAKSDETSEREYFISLLAIVIGLYGFIMGLHLILQDPQCFTRKLDLPILVAYFVWRKTKLKDELQLEPN